MNKFYAKFCRIIITIRHNITGSTPALTNLCLLYASCHDCGRQEGRKQEAPLTLRGQRGRCRNIKAGPQIYESFPNPRPCALVLWVWFYGGPWQTQAYSVAPSLNFSLVFLARYF